MKTSAKANTRSPGFANDIASLARTIASFEQRLREGLNGIVPAEKRVQKARESLDVEMYHYTGLTSNLRHMRGPADHVVLIEYVEVLRNRDSARDALILARLELAKQLKHQRKLNESIASLKSLIETAKQTLASYGCVYKFK